MIQAMDRMSDSMAAFAWTLGQIHIPVSAAMAARRAERSQNQAAAKLCFGFLAFAVLFTLAVTLVSRALGVR